MYYIFVMLRLSGGKRIDGNRELSFSTSKISEYEVNDVFGGILDRFKEIDYVDPENYGQLERNPNVDFADILKYVSFGNECWGTALFSMTERDFIRYKLTEPTFKKFIDDPLSFLKQGLEYEHIVINTTFPEW